MLRRHLDATSPIISNAQASGDRLQSIMKEDEDVDISAVAFLVPLAQAMAERNHQSIDDVQVFASEFLQSPCCWAIEFLHWQQCEKKELATLAQLMNRRSPMVHQVESQNSYGHAPGDRSVSVATENNELSCLQTPRADVNSNFYQN